MISSQSFSSSTTITPEKIINFVNLIVNLASDIHQPEQAEIFKNIAIKYLDFLKRVLNGNSFKNSQELALMLQSQKEYFKNKMNLIDFALVVNDIFKQGESIKQYLEVNPLINKFSFLEDLEKIIAHQFSRDQEFLVLKSGNKHKHTNTFFLSELKQEWIYTTYTQEDLIKLKHYAMQTYHRIKNQIPLKNYELAINDTLLAIDKLKFLPKSLKTEEICSILAKLESLYIEVVKHYVEYCLCHHLETDQPHSKLLKLLRNAIVIVDKKIAQTEADKLNKMIILRGLALILNSQASFLIGLDDEDDQYFLKIEKKYMESLNIMENLTQKTPLDLENQLIIQINYAEFLLKNSDYQRSKEEFISTKNILINLSENKSQLKLDLENVTLKILFYIHFLDGYFTLPLKNETHLSVYIKENLAAMTILDRDFYKLGFSEMDTYMLAQSLLNRLYMLGRVAIRQAQRTVDETQSIQLLELASKCFNFIDDKELHDEKERTCLLKHFLTSINMYKNKNFKTATDEIIKALKLVDCKNDINYPNFLFWAEEILTAKVNSNIKENNFFSAKLQLRILSERIDREFTANSKINNDLNIIIYNKWTSIENMNPKSLESKPTFKKR